MDVSEMRGVVVVEWLACIILSLLLWTVMLDMDDG